MTHATLLRHFGTKEQLVQEVISAIRVGLLENLRAAVGDDPAATPAHSMRTVWRQLCEPDERRQFVLLFELVALESRVPDRFGSLASVLITDFLPLIEAGLRTAGRSPAEARDLATAWLAQLRGLQLDLVVSGDRPRVDAAMDRYIDLITGTGDRSLGVSRPGGRRASRRSAWTTSSPSAPQWQRRGRARRADGGPAGRVQRAGHDQDPVDRCLISDGIHPSGAGQAVMVDLLDARGYEPVEQG